MDKVYKIGKSKIHGNGLIAIKDLVAGDLVGLSHVNNEATPDVGKFHNHSDNANTVNVEIGNERYLVVEKPIKKGEEITVNYRLQPDLEQPEDFLDKALDGGGINYPISGEVSYVNGDNMTLQPTRSKTYANDILGQLTYEQQVNGNPFEVKQRVGVRKNPDGSESTHLMRTETIDGINWVSFPTLFQNPDGSWLDMSDEENWKIPMMEAKKRGELVYFGKDKKAALEFGKGSWKSDEKSIMDREQTIPKAQWGKGFKLTNNTTTGQIGSGIGGNTIFRGIKGLPAANTFHTNWYTHPNFIANTNTKNQWNLRDFNQSLISGDVMKHTGVPLVHESALVKQPDGSFIIDKSQVDPLASKFSMQDYQTGNIPEGFYFTDEWRSGNVVPYTATSQNLYEKFPVLFSGNFIPTTRLNPENLQISGLYDEFKYNMGKMPDRVKNIYNSEFIPSWKKPGLLFKNAIRPFSEYITNSMTIGGRASSMQPGDAHMPDRKYGDMYPTMIWSKYAPSLEVHKGFSNTPISGQITMNYNPLMKIDPSESSASIVVHERGHLMDNAGRIYPDKYKNMFSSAVKSKDEMGGFFNKLSPFNFMGYGYDYFTQPTEQYARMMQERHRLGLTPADEYTFDMFKQNKGMFGMGQYLLKDEKGVPVNFIKNMNTIYKEGGEANEDDYSAGLRNFLRTMQPVISKVASRFVPMVNMLMPLSAGKGSTKMAPYPIKFNEEDMQVYEVILGKKYPKEGINLASPEFEEFTNALNLAVKADSIENSIAEQYNIPLQEDGGSLPKAQDGDEYIEQYTTMKRDGVYNPYTLTDEEMAIANKYQPVVDWYGSYLQGNTFNHLYNKILDNTTDAWVPHFMKSGLKQSQQYVQDYPYVIQHNDIWNWDPLDNPVPVAPSIIEKRTNTGGLHRSSAGNQTTTKSRISIDPQNEYFGPFSTEQQEGIMAHELGHTEGRFFTGSPELDAEIRKRNKAYQRVWNSLSEEDKKRMTENPVEIDYWLSDNYNSSSDFHDAASHEVRSDIIRFRYLADKAGIYNSSGDYKKFNESDLKKMKEQFGNNRLFRHFEDEDIIWLMDNVAQQTPQGTDNPFEIVDDFGQSSFMSRDGGQLPKAQWGKGLKIGKQNKPSIITNIADDINLYKYNKASDAFGITGANLSGSVVGPQNYSGSLIDYRALGNTEAYDPATMFLMNEYTIDSAPFKFSVKDWEDNPAGWSINTAWPDRVNDEWLKFALSNKIQGNTVGWKSSSRDHLPIHLTRNFNLGENTLLGVHGDIGQLTSLLKSGDPYQLGSISSWSVGTAGSPQFGNDRYIIKDFQTDYPALLNEYKNLTNNQAKVWKERELLLDNPTFQVTNIIENAPRTPYWRITTSPETTLKSSMGSREWKIGEDVLNPNIGDVGSVITQWNPFNKTILGKTNPYYQSLYDASLNDPNFKIKAIPEYGTDIELKIIKKKGGETTKKSKYQDSPFTKGKITYSDPTEILNNLISQGIFTSEFKMGGEKKLDNGLTIKKEFDVDRNIPYITYMKEPSIEGRLYYDSDSKNDLDDFNLINVESELIKRKIKHKRTKDIILKYQNGEKLSNAERARLNSLGLLD